MTEALQTYLDAAVAERAQFLERLTALRTAVKKLETCDFDLAVAAVKGTPEEELVQAVCEADARRSVYTGRLHDLVMHFYEESGGDPSEFDPWDDHGV